MNLNEYISSGILESYAAGELTESERAEVERNLAQYPELRKELAVVEQTMEAFFMRAGKSPRASVKERVMKATAPKAKVVSLWKYAIAASVAIILSLVGYNLFTKKDITKDPAFAKVILKGTENAPEALATVYWNQQTQEVYLEAQNLKPLTKDQQYQLWAIVDGKPVDMGVFDSESGLIKMKMTGNAAAFAVTIEPRGGKPAPTMETMQVLGNT